MVQVPPAPTVSKGWCERQVRVVSRSPKLRRLSADAAAIIEHLKAIGEPTKTEKKAQRFGIVANNALGVHQKELNLIAKQIGFNNQLALELYASELYEPRLLCSKIYNPHDLSARLMDQWAGEFENWEICDSFCIGLFCKTPHALDKVNQWASRREIYVKRAAFAIAAAYGFAHKLEPNSTFLSLLTLIQSHADDERHYVKKAISWALRNIGKRNRDLRDAATAVARDLVVSGGMGASWVGRDALRELTQTKLKILDYPRSIYRPS